MPERLRYERKMQWWPTPAGTEGFQKLILVGFAEGTWVGYATVELSINHDREMRKVYVGFMLDLVLVLPLYRGKGYGIDLSIGCATIASDVMTALYRSIPIGYEVDLCIEADYESKGGERLTKDIYLECQYRRDCIMDINKRKGVAIAEVELDAGW